nr:baseplate wedge [uncultured Mediterranean phage uvMED]
MSAIITEKFRKHNADQFHESFSEASANAYYLFIGKATAFTSSTTTGSDSSPPTPADAVGEVQYYAWDSMLAAKKITSSDIQFAIPRRNWTNGTVFDMYKHNISSSNTATSGASNLFDSTFYFMTSDFRVYKVLDNNGGTAFSGSEPTSESTSAFALGGYVLKYMYKISASDASKYITTDFIPVATDSTVSTAATDGAIESVVVTAGSGYTDGTYYAAVFGDGTNQGTSSGAIIRITVTSGSIQSFGLTAGSDTTIHAAGASYTFGTVNLGDDFIFSDSSLSSSTTLGASGSGGAIEVIISPKEGHGNNAVTELGGHYVMTATTLSQAEGDDLTTANDFRQVGLVVDPTTFGTSTVASATTARQTYVVKGSATSGTFEADEQIVQTSTGAVGKVVEFDSDRSLLYYQQERFSGFGTSATNSGFTAFSGTNLITGQTSGATLTPSSDTETVTLANSNTLTLTTGYANPELQPDSGNIIYLENRKPIQRDSDQTEDIKLIIEF